MGYNYLVNEVGFEPRNIVVAGDSAGGNLALALVMYLADNRGTSPTLPEVPHDLLLLSPWSDVGISHDIPGSSIFLNGTSDFLTDPEKYVLILARKAYCGVRGFAEANKNPYISPGSIHTNMPPVSFKGFPRTLIVVGTGERLLDQNRTLRGMMLRDMEEGLGEGQLAYHEELDAVHDFMVLPWEEPSRSNGMRKVAQWFGQPGAASVDGGKTD